MRPELVRQADIIPEDKLSMPITIIGAGAIGSFTCLALSKMGFDNITVWDYDTIEIENMNCQFYRLGDVGKPKVQALKELVYEFTGMQINVIQDQYVGTKTSGILISAVDSMKVRRLIWESHEGKTVTVPLVIDPRMGAESALVYAMNPMNNKDRQAYHTSLYSDEDAVNERCTAKATMYTACMLSGHVAKIVKDYVTQNPYSRITQWNIAQNQMLTHPSQR